MANFNEYSWVAITSTSDVFVTLYYVILSGDNIELARIEVESLLRIGGDDFSIRWHGKLGLIECKKNPLLLLLERAALVRETGTVLVEENQIESLLGGMTQDLLESVVFENRSFSIIYHELEKVLKQGEKQRFVEKLGAKIQSFTGAPVSLKQPDTRISTVSTTDLCIIGQAFESSQRRLLGLREPSKRPFFHPSMMNSILARVMCNIAEVRPNHLVLDPFCGGGSILCEASLIGARVVGVDMNWKLLRGAKTNLVDQGTHQFSLLQGDSRYLPVNDYDRIVTDPPYGRSSSTRGAQAINLVESMIERFTSSVDQLVLCICASKDMKLRDTFVQYGLSVEHSVQIPVHSGLTREVFKVRS
jgi:tRNA (guanine10-N2)-dimethyltransferase